MIKSIGVAWERLAGRCCGGGVGAMLGVSVGLFALTVGSVFFLGSNSVNAVDNFDVVDDVNIMVPVSCTLSSTGTGTHVAQINNGSYNSAIGVTTIDTYCNDKNGFAIYAVGYTDDIYGKNVMTNETLGSGHDIATGTGTSGGTSQWAMKLATDPNASYPMELQNSFGSFQAVPSTYTLVAKRTSGTDIGAAATGSVFTTTYQAYVSPTQASGTYIGQVRYTLVHPSSAVNVSFYELMAMGTKGTQTPAELEEAITTSNSGIFTYDAATFGAASDASNDHPIYYYRGILDSNLDGTGSTYGSNGNGETWPNYVKLIDGTTGTATCWRIIRTTGSGGVKMIYNGLYGATTEGSCANALTAARVGTSRITPTDAAARFLSLSSVGYTYNPSYASASATTETALGLVLGSNTNPESNTADSLIKDYVENTWYDNAIGSYTSILESSAGYCNDRSMYIDGSFDATDVLSESANVLPYDENATVQYMTGAYVRNWTISQKPTLSCPRNIVDLYTVAGASTGNGQLSKPVALITADELTFAGSGGHDHDSLVIDDPGYANNPNSYLRSGSSIWTMSPEGRNSNGNDQNKVRWFSFRDRPDGTGPYGYIYHSYVTTNYGVRPVISLKPGIAAVSGTGTAVDPWVVVP